MKILMLNGSPRPEGDISTALREMEGSLQAEGKAGHAFSKELKLK